MCGRYGLWVQPKDLEQRFDGHIEFDYEPLYNIAPESRGGAVVKNESPDEINLKRCSLGARTPIRRRWRCPA